ncbi:MAG: DUF418 domain-containing protein [Phycisphaerales bacterium]|nr:DUF418 domain-containing protein [Phycisphaerales bacterium]
MSHADAPISTTPIPATPLEPPRAAPVREGARIDAIDAARGFALLGIFCVNILLFAEPMGRIVDVVPTGTLGDAIAHYFVLVFCQGKFYSLFSLLFGIGFVLMRGRAVDKGARWVPVYLRRTFMLGALGLVHALIFWYGDILFIYALAAIPLMLMGRVGPRALTITAVVILSIATLLGGLFSAVSYVDARTPTTAVAAPAPESSAATEAQPETQPDAAPDAAPPADASELVEPSAAPAAEPEAASPAKPADAFWSTPFGQLIHGFKHQKIQDPSNTTWRNLETRVYQEGPFSQVFMFRAFTWLMILMICLFGFGWSVIAMFFIGAALAKADAFSPERLHWHRRFVMLGLCVGLPVSIAAAFLPATGLSIWTMLAHVIGNAIAAPLMALGYLGAITLFIHSGRWPRLAQSLMATGRMALTNYLTQTIIATSVFYYWGLGYFGSTPRPYQLALVFGVYSVQLLIISPLWMRFFRYGPMEWLWRAFTYLTLPRLRRGNAPPA